MLLIKRCSKHDLCFFYSLHIMYSCIHIIKADCANRVDKRLRNNRSDIITITFLQFRAECQYNWSVLALLYIIKTDSHRIIDKFQRRKIYLPKRVVARQEDNTRPKELSGVIGVYTYFVMWRVSSILIEYVCM